MIAKNNNITNTIATGNINNAPSPLKMSVHSEIYNNEKKNTNKIPPIILLSLFNIEELFLSSIFVLIYFKNNIVVWQVPLNSWANATFYFVGV